MSNNESDSEDEDERTTLAPPKEVMRQYYINQLFNSFIAMKL